MSIQSPSIDPGRKRHDLEREIIEISSERGKIARNLATIQVDLKRLQTELKRTETLVAEKLEEEKTLSLEIQKQDELLKKTKKLLNQTAF